jgi:hypothetical protein
MFDLLHQVLLVVTNDFELACKHVVTKFITIRFILKWTV